MLVKLAPVLDRVERDVAEADGPEEQPRLVVEHQDVAVMGGDCDNRAT
jgi:hypothetical protein